MQVRGLVLFVLMLMVGCAAPAATRTPVSATPTRPPASATPTWTPVSATPTRPPVSATPTSLPAITPQAGPPATWRLAFYAGLGMTYDATRWDLAADTLASRSIQGCRIKEQGPTEVPQPVPTPTAARLGKVGYEVYAYVDRAANRQVAWYLARQWPEGYSGDRGIPVLIVSAGADRWSDCDAEARRVLETLRVIS